MSMLPRAEEYSDWLARLYPELMIDRASMKNSIAKSVTFQVTDACNLACSYCYQTHKGNRVMSFDTAKKLIDLLFSGDKGMKSYIDSENMPGIILEFIGGEPTLEIDLIDQIIDYFRYKSLELNHSWAEHFRISICSNGILYSDPNVQRILEKHKYYMSFSVTLDGDKELHDRCRLFPDGRPTYDIAVAASKDWSSKGNYMGSKITIAPANVDHVYEASKHMVELGYRDININCVYEEGWEPHHATTLYHQLLKFADYLLDNDIEDIYYAFFSETNYKPQLTTENQNWCGGNGVMLACDPDGNLYPCLRYMESSIGDEQVPYTIGDVDNGIGYSKEHCDRLSCLDCITRRSQSTDECFDCPISMGCGWCSAYNYQLYGTPNKRATYICDTHKAESLANIYFWNKYYRKYNIDKRLEMHCPKDWAIPIIGESEYERLSNLSR